MVDMMMQKVVALLASAAVVCSGACSDSTQPGHGEQIIWSVPSGAGSDLPFDPDANADRSMIYFGTTDTRLRKVRGSDGKVIWDVTIATPMQVFPRRNVVTSSNVVAVSRVSVYAFDSTYGTPRWTYNPGGENPGYSPLAANDSTIFAAAYSGRLHAINAKTGVARWVTDLTGGAPNIVGYNPTFASGQVFACTVNFGVIPNTGTMWALDATTGAVQWSYPLTPEKPGQGSACYGYAPVWQHLVIVTSADGRVFALDRSTGQVQWTAPHTYDANSNGDERWAGVGGGVVLVTSGSTPAMIVAYEVATGVERWRRMDYGGSLYPPVLDSTAAFVDHGWIFASYDLATGSTRWQTPQSLFDPQTTYKGRPIVTGSRVYVAGRDGSYALKR